MHQGIGLPDSKNKPSSQQGAKQIQREFTSAVHAGKFLCEHKLVHPDREGSPRIRVNGRQFRVWEIAPDVVLDACGEGAQPEDSRQSEQVELHPQWTDDALEGAPDE